MRTVYPPSLRVALPSFVRAASLHIGAAAAAVALRADLVESDLVPDEDFSRCYAVARLTPGTNLLALYTALGYRIASWRGAALALAVGAVVPAAITISAAAVYLPYASNPVVTRFMAGAKAGALAVLLWAVVRLARPVVQRYRLRALLLAVGTLALALSSALSPFVILLVVGGVGAFILDTPP